MRKKLENQLKMPVRLNKYLADSGVASRRKAEDLILEGRVEVNDKVIIDLGFKVDTDKDQVSVDGEKIRPKKHVYFLLNKPAGYVTTTSDEKKRKTVIELIKSKEKIYPVGRLDYNTTGILLLTNDGDFTNLLTHPRNKVPRVYEAMLNRILVPEDREKLLSGVYLDGVKGKFEDVLFPKGRDKKFVVIRGTEGRNHFVKKMFSALGYSVLKLNRKSFAGMEADIPEGQYRKLSPEEVEKLIKKYAH